MRREVRAIALAIAPLPIVAAVALGGVAQAAQAQVAVPGNVNPAVATSHRAGDLPADRQLSVAVGLKLHNTAELDGFLAQVSNPRSAMYGHYLTPQQFADRFGPTKAELDRVSSFLTGKGLHVTGTNNQVVNATGSAEQVSAAFGTRLGVYQDPAANRQFFANDSAPLLPSGVAELVQGVSGLDNHAVRKHSEVAAPSANPNASGLAPDALRSIYNTNPIGGDGSGQTVVLYEFDGYKQSDIAYYDKNYNLGSSAPVTVPVNGQNYDSNPGAGQDEVTLDIELVQAMAPKASTLVYEAENSDPGELNMVNQIVKDNKASITSISWGLCEKDMATSQMTNVNNAYKQGEAQGQSFFAATGDDGSRGCTRSNSGSSVVSAGWPGTSPSVTGVGGTTLTVGSNNTYGSERGWSGSGGGTSTVFDAPSWQTGVNGKRTEPDVALDADPQTGYAIYTQGSWKQYGGTSCAAPMWAGWAALYNQKAGKKLGNGNQAFYQIGAGADYGKAFHDITSGSNTDFSAKAGYDQVTGWGSYNGSGLFTVLNGTPTGNTVSVTNPGDQTTKVGGSVNLQIKATDSSSSAKLTYSASGLPAGLSIDSASGLITGTASTAGTSNVTVTVTDDTKASGNTSFKWTVGDTPPPTGTVTVTSPGDQWGFKGYKLFQNIQVKATASDGGALTFSATGLPAGVTISSSGLISGTPTAAGTTTVTVTAKEANGTSGSASFKFQIYGF